MKLIVTGERDWTDREQVWRELTKFLRGDPTQHVLVHGDCPTGADRFADEWGAANGILTHAFKVRPDLDGPWPGAGPKRNRRMVDAHRDADGGLAFWSGRREKSGTLDCASYMTECGIPVRIVPRVKR